MIQPRIEPRSPGLLANTLPIKGYVIFAYVFMVAFILYFVNELILEWVLIQLYSFITV